MQALTFGEWPYAGKRCVVLTSRPLPSSTPADVEAWGGDAAALAGELRRSTRGDIWVVGGGRTARAFLDAGSLDRVELYVIPVALGSGIPVFAAARSEAFRLASARTFPSGVAELVYHLPR